MHSRGMENVLVASYASQRLQTKVHWRLSFRFSFSFALVNLLVEKDYFSRLFTLLGRSVGGLPVKKSLSSYWQREMEEIYLPYFLSFLLPCSIAMPGTFMLVSLASFGLGNYL